MRSPPFDLLIVSDGKPELLARTRRVLAAVPAGRVAIQLRERGLTSAALLALASELRVLTEAHGALLVINDRVDIALAVGADGVHLPEMGLPPEVARSLLGPSAWIGASRHDRSGLMQARERGADYATLSPVHPVEGKAPALGIVGFGALARAVPLPIYALGGVRLADARALIDVGARGIAVMREVLSAGDPGASARRLLEALNGADG